MKKQFKKLSLNKKTISNLQPSEMSKMIGGSLRICSGSNANTCRGQCGGATRNGNTCTGHNTCYTCLNTCAYTCF